MSHLNKKIITIMKNRRTELDRKMKELDKLYEQLPSSAKLRERIAEIVDLEIQIEQECNQ